MSITLYPCISVSESGGDKETPTFGHPILTVDAKLLYDQCLKHGIATDWWFPKANSVSLIVGEQFSEAYLLIPKLYLDGATATLNDGVAVAALKKEQYRHRIRLSDTVRGSIGFSSYFDTDGWVFHSARAIDASSSESDLNTIYLVKFVDRRFLFAKTPSGISASEPPGIFKGGFNVISQTVDDTEMAFDYTSVGDFPYDTSTTNAFTPQTWQQILEQLWYQSRICLNELEELFGRDDGPYPPGSTPSEGETGLGDDALYVPHPPLDIRPGNQTAWKAFCELLHSIGLEIYPMLDGNYRVQPINTDYAYNAPSELTIYSDLLIETGFPKPEYNRLPDKLSFVYANRSRDSDYTNRAPFVGSDLFWDTQTILDDDISKYPWVSIATGTEFEQGASGIFGNVEPILTYAMSKVPGEGDIINGGPRGLFEELAIKRLLQSRLQKPVDHTYGCFLELFPNTQFEKITWFIGPGGPSTRVVSIPSSIATEDYNIPQVDTRGTDRLVAANDNSLSLPGNNGDQTPAALYDKINDHLTYDALLHNLVYVEVVYAGTPRNNKVRFFTPIGTGGGGTGPTGPAGPPGTPGPTYTDGCGIIIAGTVVSFDRGDITSLSIQADPHATTACSLAVRSSGVEACGTQRCTDDSERLKVDPNALVGTGGGLEICAGNTTNVAGPCKIKVKAEDLAGCGLKLSSEAIAATNNANGPVKLVIDLDALVGDESHGIAKLAGNQNDANGPCKLKVNTNTTINSITSIALTESGGNLTLTVNYNSYSVYATAAGGGSFTSSVGIESCP